MRRADGLDLRRRAAAVSRDRPSWCKEILERGKYIQLCTNGMFLAKKLKEFTPHPGLVFNVHLDGMEKNHDLAVEREGVFKEAIEGIRRPRPAVSRCSPTPRSTKRPT